MRPSLRMLQAPTKKQKVNGADPSCLALSSFFFHEYGRRVGMVPRSSLKEGKYSQGALA